MDSQATQPIRRRVPDLPVTIPFDRRTELTLHVPEEDRWSLSIKRALANWPFTLNLTKEDTFSPTIFTEWSLPHSSEISIIRNGDREKADEILTKHHIQVTAQLCRANSEHPFSCFGTEDLEFRVTEKQCPLDWLYYLEPRSTYTLKLATPNDDDAISYPSC